MGLDSLTRLVDTTARLHEVVRDLRPSETSPRQETVLAAAVDELDASLRQLREQEEALRRKDQLLQEAYCEALAQRQRYQQLFDFAPEGSVLTDGRGIIEDANYAAATLLQTRKEFLVGKPLAFLLGRDPLFYQRLSQLRRQSHTVAQCELTFRPRKGKPVRLSLGATVVATDDRGRPTEVRWLLRDVTAQARAEGTLRVAKSFADSLVEAAQAFILVVDARGRILRSNQYLQAAFGQPGHELRGRDWATLLLPLGHAQEGRNMLQRALISGVAQGCSCDLLTRGGDCRAVVWSAKVLDASPGRQTILLLGHDITELKQAQRLATQAERLAAIGQMVTGLAHESRNALQRSQACSEMLRWQLEGQPKALQLLDRIQKAHDDLHRLYEEVRNYAAPLRLATSVHSLAEVWREAWESLTPLRRGRDVELREQVGTVDLGCDVDRFRLEQVFRNLLDNALTACTDPVRLVISCAAASLAGRPALRVSVCDNGPGLQPEVKRKIFEPFHTTKTHGTGLGLAICQRVIEAHGGRIEVGDGPGAEFVITLPRTSA